MISDLPEVFQTLAKDAAELGEARGLLLQMENANERRQGKLETHVDLLRENIIALGDLVDGNTKAVYAFLEPLRLTDNRTWIIMLLRYVCGFQWTEIADILGFEENAIKARAYRWIEKHFSPPKEEQE